MSDRNMKIVRQLLDDVWTQGNLALLPELVAENAESYPMPEFGAVHGCEGYKQFIAIYKGAFLEMHFRIEDQFAAANKVATRWTSLVTDAAGDATRDAETGEQVSISGTTITHHDDNGKIIAEWAAWDTHALLESAAAPKIFEQLSMKV